MKIGIIGTGSIGTSLARKLAASGHEIKLANSRGPKSIRDLARDVGASAVSREEAVQGVDVVITSIPFAKYADLADLFSQVPAHVVVIDTSNYYPMRDGVIEGVDNGQPESVWVSNQIGRPVVKAWNALLAETLASKGLPAGSPLRLALPVAGDDAQAKALAQSLVETTGFDALNSGSLAESWRQQPGTPAYCTELQVRELKPALAAADRAQAPHHRDAVLKEIMSAPEPLGHEQVVALNRAITAPASH
ncbi:NADPH-dependent F420 reductase [Pseudomonas cannabina]|uniref:NAD(P)-binding domain-containing protein n=1 Tax=Pseudomonas cannabina pv. alisalensis TaxID=757414 RepID=A0ABS1XGH0_PSEC1|nr:NAD(P)-binding domain-containing protein [Pseudomonas cannabina pv. alisalensis]RMN88491.1 hypothetical protein ALQ52_03828 [Pseudomonas cannabina pv. alisalensis]